MFFFQVIYSKEQIENYLPTKWDLKLIKKIGYNTISQENISSANDFVGNRIQKLKVK